MNIVQPRHVCINIDAIKKIFFFQWRKRTTKAKLPLAYKCHDVASCYNNWLSYFSVIHPLTSLFHPQNNIPTCTDSHKNICPSAFMFHFPLFLLMLWRKKEAFLWGQSIGGVGRPKGQRKKSGCLLSWHPPCCPLVRPQLLLLTPLPLLFPGSCNHSLPALLGLGKFWLFTSPWCLTISSWIP